MLLIRGLFIGDSPMARPIYYIVSALTSEGEKHQSAVPNGEWVLEQLGTGVFDNVQTGEKVAVALAERVHPLLFPEGYTDGD